MWECCLWVYIVKCSFWDRRVSALFTQNHQSNASGIVMNYFLLGVTKKYTALVLRKVFCVYMCNTFYFEEKPQSWSQQRRESFQSILKTLSDVNPTTLGICWSTSCHDTHTNTRTHTHSDSQGEINNIHIIAVDKKSLPPPFPLLHY